MHFLDSHWLNAGQCIWYLPHLKQTFTSTFVFSFLSPMFTNVHQCLPLHRWCSLYTWCALLPFLPCLSLLDWITVSHRMVACSQAIWSVQPERFYLNSQWYIYEHCSYNNISGTCTTGKILSWWSVQLDPWLNHSLSQNGSFLQDRENQ